MAKRSPKERPSKDRDSKFEVFGKEMLVRTVKRSGNSGRIYLPPTWIGCRVNIIRVD